MMVWMSALVVMVYFSIFSMDEELKLGLSWREVTPTHNTTNKSYYISPVPLEWPPSSTPTIPLAVPATRGMKVDLKTEDENRRARLQAIYEHVGDIAKKISQMDDPLPIQLEKSVPGYLDGLSSHANQIRDNSCSVVIAGKDITYLIVLTQETHNVYTTLSEGCDLVVLHTTLPKHCINVISQCYFHVL